MKSINFKNNRGFTVLEAIVAISILSISITGVFASVQKGLQQSTVAKDEVRAYYLAQEAVEIIKNKRDSNQLVRIISNPSATWLDGIISQCPFGRVCAVDAVNFNTITNCGSSWGSCPLLNQNLTSSGNQAYLYSYSAGGNWRATNFRREIQLESVSATEISVTVLVTWTNGTATRQFKAKAYLFNLI